MPDIVRGILSRRGVVFRGLIASLAGIHSTKALAASAPDSSPEGGELSVGLKADAEDVSVAPSISILASAGYFQAGLGRSDYVRDSSLDRDFARKHPRACIVARDGSVFKNASRIPDVYQFGAAGTGLVDDNAAWEELCKFAISTGLRRISLSGAVLGGRRTFILPPNVELLSCGGAFKALSGFQGEALVSTSAEVQYRDLIIDSLIADVGGQLTASGKPIVGLSLPWVAYVVVDKILVRGATGHGFVLGEGTKNSLAGGTHEFYCNYVSAGAAMNVSREAAGVIIEGSDHFFNYGTVFGFAVGGISAGANNFLGTWHVWSRYKKGWAQMRLGWDASGEGNRGTIEVDSPGCVNPELPVSMQNGPIGVHIHKHAIRTRFSVLINVTEWGEDTIRPRARSIRPVVIETTANVIDVDVVDYHGRKTGEQLINKSWVVFSTENLRSRSRVSMIGSGEVSVGL